MLPPRRPYTARFTTGTRWPVRVMHWINVVALTILLMSGLQIFNAHPALYWGKSSYTGRPPLLEIGAREGGEGGMIGVTRIFGREFDTTGVLGAVAATDGQLYAQAFPWWMTIPDDQWLSMARSWHFFFAWVFVINGLCYLVYSICEPAPRARSRARPAASWRTIGQSIRDHLRFRHPTGEAAKRYNVLQKIAYLVVIFVLLPLIILMGLAMSPWLELGASPAGSISSAGGSRRARSISSSPGCWSRSC